jgi:LacI family transcriptional regulator
LTVKAGRRSRNQVTVHDVARHAGVSPMTVSRVVNGEHNVREATRAKVMASIRALHYSPNLAARSLASANTVRIGLLYSNPSAAYLSEFLVGSLEQSSLSGCQLLIEKSDGPESERKAIEKFAAAGADGVILPPPLCDSKTALAALKSVDLPAVVVATGRPAPGLSSVSIDDFEAARAMTRHIIELGHTRIAFIIGHPNQTASARRLDGFMAGMSEAGLEVDERQIEQGFFTYRSGIESAERLLTGERPPSAIFASNDDMAAGAVAVAHRLGLDVPRDLTVVGFDDTALAATVWPALTTVRQPIAEMAREAVTLLLDQIRRRRTGMPQPPVREILPFTMTPRESSAKAGPRPRSR